MQQRPCSPGLMPRAVPCMTRMRSVALSMSAIRGCCEYVSRSRAERPDGDRPYGYRHQCVS